MFVVDSIGEVRIPYLFIILREYHKFDKQYAPEDDSSQTQPNQEATKEAVDDDDDEDFMDEPELPAEFIEVDVKMMDLEVMDSDVIRQNYEELLKELEENLGDLLDSEEAAANNVHSTDAIQDVLTEDLDFFQRLNDDYHQYKASLLPN